MEKAGYEFNQTKKGIFQRIFEFLRENPAVPISIILIAGLTGIIVYKYTTFRFKNLFGGSTYSELSKEGTDHYIDHAKKIADETENYDK